MARDVIRAQAYIDHVDQPQWLLPKAARCQQRLWIDGGRIVDEDIRRSSLGTHACKQLTDLIISTMIALHRDTSSASGIDLVRRLLQRTVGGACRQIDGCADGTQGARNAAPKAAACTRDDHHEIPMTRHGDS